jgi:hypothetical protein
MRPTGAKTYLGAVVEEEIAADNFFEVFFETNLQRCAVDQALWESRGLVSAQKFLRGIISLHL